MISTLDELRSARFIMRSIAEDLSSEGVPHRENIPVGMMVEVPAAVMMMDYFVKEVDFISLGTNDLTQYTLAVDRTNESVADLYQACDPSVLRLIQRCIEVAGNAQVPASVCGEMSSHPAYALLHLGLGVRTLSAPPAAIPQVKKAIRTVSLQDCQAMADRAMKLATAREVESFLQSQLVGLLPECLCNGDTRRHQSLILANSNWPQKGTKQNMKKEMLINVSQAEECRIAILEDGVLEELYTERASQDNYVGNIYKGKIVNLEPSIQAAFVDFGVGRNGFLHISDVEAQLLPTGGI